MFMINHLVFTVYSLILYTYIYICNYCNVTDNIYIYIIYYVFWYSRSVHVMYRFFGANEGLCPVSALAKKTHGVSLTNATSASERLPTTGVALKTRPANCYCYCWLFKKEKPTGDVVYKDGMVNHTSWVKKSWIATGSISPKNRHS